LICWPSGVLDCDMSPKALQHSDSEASSDVCERKYTTLRNRYFREFASEFMGTMVLIVFGLGANLQVVLSSSSSVASQQQGSQLSRTLAAAAAFALGVWTSSVSGGHINPAVTLSQAILRGFPWRKVPIYITAQLLGATIGALILYANYYHAINLYEGGNGTRSISTASLFTTYALDYMPNSACFFSEFLGTAFLVICLYVLTDKSNGPPPQGLVPLGLFFLLFCEGASLGMETSYALNPARDLGPRIALAMVGYSREILWNYRHQYWIWVPILGPICGGIFGGTIYDALIFNGPENVFNRLWVTDRVRRAPLSKEMGTVESLVIPIGESV